VVFKGAEVAYPLRPYECAERVFGFRYVQVIARRIYDDNENAVVRAPLMKLTGAVQIAWPNANGNGAACGIAKGGSRTVERFSHGI
jgi:hypothetical protein